MIWIASVALATGPAASVGDVAGAAAFDYCAWHFSDPTPGTPTLPAGDDLDSATAVSTMLVQTGVRIAQHSRSARSCARVFHRGTQRDQRAFRKARARLRSGHDPADDAAHAAVQDEVGRLWADDQAARRVYLQSRTMDEHGVEAWARALAVRRARMADEASTAFMRGVVDQFGWVDAHRFGMPTARHAWLLVQHADRHPELQARALEQMEPFLASEGVRPQDYAYLFDRVAVNHGREQRFGTQPIWECRDDGTLGLAPLEDPDHVDERRSEMGLEPVDVQLAEMSRSVCG